MRVRTIRKHVNEYGEQPVKNLGRKYDAPERTARNLISAGFVVADVKDNDPA